MALRFPGRAKEVRDLLRSNGGTRKIGRKGIEFGVLSYHSPELAALRSAIEQRTSRRGIAAEGNEVGGDRPLDEELSVTVAVRYDPGDLSAIYIWNPIYNEGTWLRVPAIDQEYTQGLTIWKHRAIQKHLRQQQKAVDSASLRTAKGAIQKLVEQEFHLTRQNTRGQRKAVRYHGTGIQPTPDVDVLAGRVLSTPASSLNTTLPLSGIPDESGVVGIENSSTDSAPSGGFTSNRDTRQPVSIAARKPRKIAQGEASGPRTPPTLEP